MRFFGPITQHILHPGKRQFYENMFLTLIGIKRRVLQTLVSPSMMTTESYALTLDDFHYLIYFPYIVDVINVLCGGYGFSQIVVIVMVYIPRVELLISGSARSRPLDESLTSSRMIVVPSRDRLTSSFKSFPLWDSMTLTLVSRQIS